MATRYRDLQQPTMLQPGVVDSGGAETAARLADSFKSFENTAAGFGRQFSAQRGAERGAAEGAAGKPELRTGFRALTASGQAYNNAAEATYATKLELDSDEALDRIEIESNGNLPDYQTGATAWIDTTLKDVPPQLRVRAGQFMRARFNAGLTRVTLQAEAKEQDEALAKHLESMPQMLSGTLKTAKDLPEAESDAEIARAVFEHKAKVDTLVGLTAVQKVKLHAAFIADLDQGFANQTITDTVTDLMSLTKRNVMHGDKALAALDAREDLSPEERDAISTEYWQQRSQWARNQSGLHVESITAVSRRLTAGDHGPGVLAAVRQLYKVGAISVDEREGYENAEIRNQEEAIREKALADAVSAAGRGSNLEPWNPKHRAGVEALFLASVKKHGLQIGDERYQDLALAITVDKQILPDSAVSWASQTLMTGTPEQALAAAKFMDRALVAAPRAFEFNDDHYNAMFGHLLLSSVQAGAPPERAYELAEKLTDPTNKPVQELRDKQYLEATDPKKGSVQIPRALVKALDIDDEYLATNAGTAALVEYEQNVRRLYVAGGDMQAALDVAGQYARSWGLTNVNGVTELVKYPLEQVGQDPIAVRADVTALLAAEGADVDPLTVTLRPIRNTEYTKGFMWGLTAPDEYGIEDNVRGSRNQPLGYALPTNKEEFDRQVLGKEDYLREQARVKKESALRYTEQMLENFPTSIH